jgi:hypothetical protein
LIQGDSGHGPLHARPEARRIDRREAVQERLDLLEALEQPLRLDEARSEKRAHVLAVESVVPLDLGESLRVRIEVIEAELPPVLGRQAALLPAGGERDEVPGRRELDVDGQLVLQAGDRA